MHVSSLKHFAAPTKTLKHSLVLILFSTLFFISGCDAPKPTPVATTDFDNFELEVYPSPSAIIDLVKAPSQPFVAMNAMIYKDQATGDKYAGLTGREAYLIYAEGVIEDQQALESRMIWVGNITAQFRGFSDPVFEDLALLEYSSPASLLKFMTSPGEAPDARSAGLLGQWNLFAPTLAESGEDPTEVLIPELPSTEELSTLTDLSQAQIELILASPSDAPVFIIDMYRYADDTGEIYSSYHRALTNAQVNYGGTLVWHGDLEFFFLGDATPAFHSMTVSGYPSAEAYLLTLIDPEVLAEQSALTNGLSIHWSYTAQEEQSDLLTIN